MKKTTQPTYVLFGKEAISLYKLSLKLLINSDNVKYTIGAYTNVYSFVADQNRWDDFTIINKRDYAKLSKHLEKNKSEDHLIPFFDTLKRTFSFQAS